METVPVLHNLQTKPPPFQSIRQSHGQRGQPMLLQQHDLFLMH
jgi:hypothetical protein